MRLAPYDSLDQLRRDGERWDDLWRRSEFTLPTLRAELLAQWVEHFAPHGRFVALAVEDGPELVAALPIVGMAGAAGRVLGQLPRNCWSASGNLLLNPTRSPSEAVRLLVEGLRRLPWPVVLADGVNAESASWRMFLAELQEQRLSTAARFQYSVGLVDVAGDWEAYEASWSGNHRRALRKSLRKLKETGALEMARHAAPTPEDAGRLLRTFCEIEDKSWKGGAGSSILRTPGMFDFFERQARQLAEWGQLEILFLECDGRPIASDFGYAAKGVFHSHKIAYDPEFRQVSPGQVLFWLQLEDYFAHDDFRLLDTLGVLSESNAKWATRAHPVSRVLLSTSRTVGNPLVAAYARLWPKVKRLLGRKDMVYPAIEPGAATYVPLHKEAEVPCSV